MRSESKWEEEGWRGEDASQGYLGRTIGVGRVGGRGNISQLGFWIRKLMIT